MGALQMAETEPSGNTISKGQEKLRKPSTESSQSPKGTQPSCLRGAFIRIFLKREEPNSGTEKDSVSNQNTEDQAEVRGKKRRMTGSIFRLPCLRPAETTGNDIQVKTEEQSNVLVEEEELKPYSKASFLRKIRCYRLMREKDATEKEKVIEMAQRKHDREDAEVKQLKERVLEQSEEGLQRIKKDEVVGEKGMDTKEQDSNAESLVEAGGDVQEKGIDIIEQDYHANGLLEAGGDVQEGDVNVEHVGEQENSLKKQEGCAEKLSGKGEESGKIDGHAQGLGEMGKDTTDQESCVKTLKEKSDLLVGEMSLLDDKKLEQKFKIRKPEVVENVLDGVREQVEDMLEHKNHAAKVEDIDNALSEEESQPVEVENHEKHMSNRDEEAMEKILASQDSHGIVTTDAEESVGAMQNDISKNKYNSGELGDAVNYLPEQEGHSEKVGNAESNLSEQQHLEEDMEDTRHCLSEQDGQIGRKGLEEGDMSERDSQGDSSNKAENNQEKDCRIGISVDQKNNLIHQESQVENTRKEISQLGSQNIMKDTQGKTVEEFEDNTEDLSRISSGVQDELNFTNNMSNQGLTTTIMNQESVISETSQLQDSSSKRTLGSDDNKELPASVRKKTSSNDIITCEFSEEEHTEVLKLQKEVLTSTKNPADLTYQEPNTLYSCVRIEDDDMGCDSRDLGSLREEVKDMVEWLVQEASDRLSIYAQESESTG